jgi:hypothetical protein
LAQYATGDETAEFGRRGFSTLPHLASEVVQGNVSGKDVSAISPYVATLSMPVQTGLRALGNRDFTGKQIIPTQDYTQPKNVGRAAAAAADFAAKNLISPYNMVSSAVTKESTPGDVANKYFASLFGVSTKSDAAQRFLNKENRNVQSQSKARFKRPPGMAEELYNRLVGRW